MPVHFTRRAALAQAALLPIALASSRGASTRASSRLEQEKAPAERLRDLETAIGGRLGVAAVDTGSGARLAHRADERFPMCSTFKFLAAAAVLARVDRNEERLDRRLPFGKGDLLDPSPVTTARVAEGSLPLADLCEAAIVVSDNTAANLLLSTFGGPAGLTSYVRSLGDTVTRLDRIELALNEATPGDPRDTTTPAAMLHSLRTLLLGDALSQASRDRLSAWLVANTRFPGRLRAGLPAGWKVGNKPGTCGRGSTNDVAILWPPGRPPILVAAYLTESTGPLAQRDAVLAYVARIVVASLSP